MLVRELVPALVLRLARVTLPVRQVSAPPLVSWPAFPRAHRLRWALMHPRDLIGVTKESL